MLIFVSRLTILSRMLSLTKDGVIDNITWHNSADFYHFRISLSAFSAKAGGEDIEIPLYALESLRLHFMKYQNQGATLIVRFAYDGFSGEKDLEPNIELIKKLRRSTQNYI